MTIAVIGTGNIGSTLARAFATAGLDVVLASRNPSSVTTADVSVTSTPEALSDADTVVLAIPGQAVAEFLERHASQLDGTLIVDATNRFPNDVLHSAEDVADLVPGARYARAFNSLTWESFAEPTYKGERGDLLFSSAERDRATVEQLIDAVGLRPRYLGPEQHDALDKGIALLFPFFQSHGRHVGIRILTED